MIGLADGSINQIKENLQKIKESSLIKSKDIDENTCIHIFNILSNKEFQSLIKEIKDQDYYKEINYERFNKINEVLESMFYSIHNLKEEYDINLFLNSGYILDEKEIKLAYNKKIREKHPNLNIKRLIQLYKEPPKKLNPYYSNKEEILIDEFVYRKYIVALIQMIFNQMDLVIAFTGGEGTGKSTKLSQDMYVVWWTLTEIGIINYPFDIKDMFFNTLEKLREAEDKYFHTPFRIFGLDEGNELNRQNWKDEEVNTFFQRLRRERYNQRIKYISIPVLGEMIPNIVLSRVNFVFEMEVKNKIKSGTLEKGIVNFYIIPRGNKIYSPQQKRELTKENIKNTLYLNLKDKAYLKGMPKKILIKKFKANGIWGFPEKEYNKYLKDTNEIFSVSKGVILSETESFYFYKTNIKLKDLGIKHTDHRYSSMAKLLNRIKNYWEKNPDKLLRYEAIYKRKMEKTL